MGAWQLHVFPVKAREPRAAQLLRQGGRQADGRFLSEMSKSAGPDPFELFLLPAGEGGEAALFFAATSGMGG